MDPEDLLRNAIDFSIVFGTCKGLRVLLHGEDLLPAAREGEGDGVAATASESVNQNALRLGRGGDVLGDFSDRMSVRSVGPYGKRAGSNFAMGMGVTPNQASSVSQMPSSYLSKML